MTTPLFDGFDELSTLAHLVNTRQMVPTHSYLIQQMLSALIKAERFAEKTTNVERQLDQIAVRQEATRQPGATDLNDMRAFYYSHDPTWREMDGTRKFWLAQAQVYATAAQAVHSSIAIKLQRS